MISVLVNSDDQCFYAPAALGMLGHRAFGLSICPSIDQVKIFAQGRISRSINGRELIFYNMRMYLYETSRNIQKSSRSLIWVMMVQHKTSDQYLISGKVFTRSSSSFRRHSLLKTLTKNF